MKLKEYNNIEKKEFLVVFANDDSCEIFQYDYKLPVSSLIYSKFQISFSMVILENNIIHLKIPLKF